MVRSYRKLPVVIEALQFASNFHECCDFVGRENISAALSEDEDVIVIRTLEGPMYAQVDDYIIKGVAGEFYPCKPDIFEATYEMITVETKE